MKVALSIFSILLTGILNLSGGAFIPQHNSSSDCTISDLDYDSVQDSDFHFNPNHKEHTELKVAEFEIEESSEKISKTKTNQILPSAIQRSQLEGVCNFHLSLPFIHTRARASLADAVKPYILFQVFRL